MYKDVFHQADFHCPGMLGCTSPNNRVFVAYFYKKGNLQILCQESKNKSQGKHSLISKCSLPLVCMQGLFLIVLVSSEQALEARTLMSQAG